MSVYVGIDVHRKRSRVAVVTEDGTVQLNKNAVNGTAPILRLIGDLPSGTPVAFEAVRTRSRLARRRAAPDRGHHPFPQRARKQPGPPRGLANRGRLVFR